MAIRLVIIALFYSEIAALRLRSVRNDGGEGLRSVCDDGEGEYVLSLFIQEKTPRVKTLGVLR